MSMTNSNRELEENTCQCTEDAKFTLFTTEPEENPIVTPEKCPTPVSITIGACEDAIVFDAGKHGLESLGRILQITVTLKDICPHKRVALAVILTEVDSHGMEHKRGIKTITVPAHDKQHCTDVTVRCIKFVLPEDLDEMGDKDSICNERKFKARFIANYIDTDFACCDIVL